MKWPRATNLPTVRQLPIRRHRSKRQLGELRAQVRNFRARRVLDLNEVTLVDVAGVHFLIACEAEGIELLHCSPYIREWMDREQDTTRGGSI